MIQHPLIAREGKSSLHACHAILLLASVSILALSLPVSAHAGDGGTQENVGGNGGAADENGGTGSGGYGGLGGSAGQVPGAYGENGYDGSSDGIEGGGGGGGGGGASGYGGGSLNNNGTLRGGNGGNGGSAHTGSVIGLSGSGGGGGDGGHGALYFGNTINSNTGSITGGDGGEGGNGNLHADGWGGSGGIGGYGVWISGSSTFNNAGTITGGKGGYPGIGGGNGPAGYGIYAEDTHLINSGTIEGGIEPVVTTHADAIVFYGGTNILELHHGSTITGKVQAFSALDTLRLGGSNNSTFNVSGIGGQYTGFGLFEKTGASNWTLTGSGAQDWTVLGGTLTGNSISLQGDITNDATVIFDQTVDGSYGGTLSGIGVAVKTGPANLTLTGLTDQNWTLMGGTLTGDSASLQGDVANNASLVFNQTFDGIYDGTIGGNGRVTKDGSGTLTLTGTHVYSGGTHIEEGTLLVNGSLAGQTIIHNDGTLGGTGSVGSVATNGGTLAPGNGIGTLTVNGNVDFSNGGTFAVDIDPAGVSDRLEVTGTATLTGGTVAVKAGAGNYAPDTTYTILSAGGELGGSQFNTITSDLAFLDPTLSYNANDVLLTLTENDRTFEDEADTPNQTGLAGILQENRDNPAFKRLVGNLLQLNSAGAKKAYKSLSGQQHSHLPGLSRPARQSFQNQISNRLGGRSSQPGTNSLAAAFDGNDSWSQSVADAVQAASSATERNSRIWVRGYGGFGDIDGDANVDGADYVYGGAAVGADTEIWQNLIAGGALSYTRTHASSNGDTDVDSYQMAAYGRFQPNAFYLDGMVGGGLHKTDASRRIVVGTLTDTAHADYNSVGLNAGFEAGYDLTPGQGVILTPYAALHYGWLKRDSFTETGAGAANLTINSDASDSLRSTLGGRVGYVFNTPEGTTIATRVEAAWLHEYKDTGSEINAAFAAAPNSGFRIEGADTDRNSARIGAGVTVGLSSDVDLDLSYQGDLSATETAHALSVTARWKF
ncbi:autotransporter family protein [Sneathiella chinensis]|uniref:Autotransporter domain-containing protein n=1 Tax=Sneathiella chinensis TaxID=349750 RepID=A0ABQ5U5Q3_9PROT|nr:autotransporter outer membrane beta-barrel domain-containing protein [Sneathiella chinensis]GLQ07485.1 hypothetical protein GCM10007924_27060 [Sneathiella chinensis]